MSLHDIVKKAKVDSPVVSERKTYDGKVVYLHEDGSVSDRQRFVSRAKIPTDIMWRVWGDIETYTHAELPAMIKNVKKRARYW